MKQSKVLRNIMTVLMVSMATATMVAVPVQAATTATTKPDTFVRIFAGEKSVSVTTKASGTVTVNGKDISEKNKIGKSVTTYQDYAEEKGTIDVVVPNTESISLIIKTNEGDITVDGVNGIVNVRSVKGNIKLSGLEGTITAESREGNVTDSDSKTRASSGSKSVRKRTPIK